MRIHYDNALIAALFLAATLLLASYTVEYPLLIVPTCVAGAVTGHNLGDVFREEDAPDFSNLDDHPLLNALLSVGGLRGIHFGHR